MNEKERSKLNNFKKEKKCPAWLDFQFTLNKKPETQK